MNSPQPPLDVWLRRPQRYWYADGLAEMAVGSIFLLVALTNLAAWRLPPGPWQSLILGLCQFLVILGSVLGARAVVHFLKERITYPRTGRVIYRRPSPSRRWLLAGASFTLAAGLAFLMVTLSKTVGQRWLPLASGFLIAFATAAGWRLGLTRLLVLALYILGVGIGLTLWPLPEPLDAAAFFGLVGLGWLASGGWALGHYLRQTRPQPEDEGEAA
ncbi:hypothetical protein [uncultured Thermanaerothrix sp.]|uniref:hypothetical protein n=1 Tax=uncultured Thermanaerothrix sp. TaxID=1195149 RepID=UPI00261F04A4|nr:hypothetical protein [uncultured Thermanaerothrix sp.]